ncbi:phosphoribosylglycinamide formyltransferase [Flavobacterium crassostreae]|uniref:phosphoribosylglycinamide formyltransferase 1 n=1 Tax=Flavobacterium crassostreae TaxID=1763534 RepID=A0A1B9E5W8_9FLAO|nr:phosphoribosylglycinamide formyltransferase [Flavobacterium crassostreae]OCB77319.1 phosphoribosylglycinamide formyltransferase [Flavobacterium crassostreae]
MKKILIFASGSGTNAENIIKHFQNKALANVVGVFTNNPNAGVIEKAQNLGILVQIFNKIDLNEGKVLQKIELMKPDLIVLAGFLWKFPEQIIEIFPNKVINIHPALLPKYGGKGMYGMHIHRAVVENKELETGITIHLVNEHYDQGAILFQKNIALSKQETPETVAQKIHQLEQECFPVVLEDFLKQSS